MKRRIFLLLMAACLGLTACQGQGVPGCSSDTKPPETVDTGDHPTTVPTGNDTTTAPTGDPSYGPGEPYETVVTEAWDPQQQPPESTAAPDPQPQDAEESWGLNSLDSSLLAWLRDNGFADKSFTVSPLSFKAALALTALGAEGETQAQILEALGFDSVEALTGWYASVLAGTAEFDSRIWGEDKDDCAYRIVNAIFHNRDCDGAFRESYVEQVSKVLGAYASSHDAAALTKAINDWVDAQTEGLIPSLVQDASDSAAVLVNALYLKTKWTEPFGNSLLTDFTTVTGETVQKEFIAHTEKYRYYADDDCQLVVLPLQGGTYMALILGESDDLTGKLASAETRKVHVTLPKFEVETSLDNKELVNYLIDRGCERMFADGGAAEFDPMFTQEIFVDDIIQKARVKVDEKGLEAAAATAVIMVRATAIPNPEEPVEFTADRPFRFVVYRDDESPEMLFYGQIMD